MSRGRRSDRRRPGVAIVSTYYWPVIGGVETHARELAGYLRARDFPVLVITKRVSPELPSRELVDGIDVFRVPPVGDPAGRAKWSIVPTVTWTLLRLRRSFDVIYCPDLRGVGVAAVLAGKLLGRPVVGEGGVEGTFDLSSWNDTLERRGLDPDGLLWRLGKGLVRRIYRRADAVCCVSRSIEQEALDCGFERQRVHYLPNGVDVERFRPAEPGEAVRIRKREGWPLDAILVVYVGRLSREKGILDLLAAWERLEPQDAHLVFVGPDAPGHGLDAGASARAHVRSRSLERTVSFHGPTEEPARLLRAADVFAHPSHWEAAGIAVLEAMATALPVVATRVGGMSEYLRHEVNGLVCEPRSPACVAEQLARLVSDSRLRRDLGRRARQTVVESFDQAAIFEAYARLLTERATTAS